MSSRRAFLNKTAGIAVLGGTLPSFPGRAAFAQPLPALGASVDPRNVLVVIQMGGGNDGLNTIVPYGDDAYHRVRPTIGIAPSTVIKIDDRIGLNPKMTALDDLYQEGHVAIVQGVGYPTPTARTSKRRRFGKRRRRIARSRAAGSGAISTATHRTRPVPPVRRRSSPRSRSAIPCRPHSSHNTSTFPPSVRSASTVTIPAKTRLPKRPRANSTTARRPDNRPTYHSSRKRRNAMHGGDLLRAKVKGYQAAVTYPADAFSQQLKLAAQIIGSNVGTRIVFVSIGSFDTHAGQRNQQDRLLGYLANGLRAFYGDLTAHALADNVLAMTFSEFGRRVAQNASNGTDHGTAMPLFIVGG